MTEPASSYLAPHKGPRARGSLGLRVLLVEDDEQVLTVLSALLELEGYEVHVARTAGAGLQRLQGQRFHLVVTDYWLPDMTSAWMLSQADQQGLLLGCKVLVITAEHRPQGVEGLTVLRKPLDLDDLLRVVHDTLQPAREQELERVRREAERAGRPAGAGEVKLELTLYVSASSPASLKALRTLDGILARYHRGQLRFTVCDLAREHPASAEEDRIVFTPTLVKRYPEPRLWILGGLDDPSVVVDLIEHAGVDRIP